MTESINQASDFDDQYFQARIKTEVLRRKMHILDRQFMTASLNQIDPATKINDRTILDIGCSDGNFLAGFDINGNYWGIEPNKNQQVIARSNGLKIVSEISTVPGLDTIVLRGVLHHLPDYKSTINEILSAFHKSNSRNKKVLFLLANPNADAAIYRKFNRLPALEYGSGFGSVFKVHSAREVIVELEMLGFECKVQYPYLNTPYANVFKDFLRFVSSFAAQKYIETPFPRNMFNLVATLKN